MAKHAYEGFSVLSTCPGPRDTITNTQGSMLLKLCGKRQTEVTHQIMALLTNSAEHYGVNSIVRK